LQCFTGKRWSIGATLQAMNDTRTHLQLINGDHALQQAEWIDLLENVDVRDALPRLRALARQMQPAANGALAVVAAETAEGSGSSPGAADSRAPD